MNENDNLKFNPITHGEMSMNEGMRNYIKEQQELMASRAKKLEGIRIANVDSTRKNDQNTRKKANKAVKLAVATILIYCMAVGIVSSRSVEIKHDVTYEGSGTNVITTGDEDIKIGEYAKEFIHNLNPINLVETEKEVRKNR